MPWHILNNTGPSLIHSAAVVLFQNSVLSCPHLSKQWACKNDPPEASLGCKITPDLCACVRWGGGYCSALCWECPQVALCEGQHPDGSWWRSRPFRGWFPWSFPATPPTAHILHSTPTRHKPYSRPTTPPVVLHTYSTGPFPSLMLFPSSQTPPSFPSSCPILLFVKTQLKYHLLQEGFLD